MVEQKGRREDNVIPSLWRHLSHSHSFSREEPASVATIPDWLKLQLPSQIPFLPGANRLSHLSLPAVWEISHAAEPGNWWKHSPQRAALNALSCPTHPCHPTVTRLLWTMFKHVLQKRRLDSTWPSLDESLGSCAASCLLQQDTAASHSLAAWEKAEGTSTVLSKSNGPRELTKRRKHPPTLSSGSSGHLHISAPLCAGRKSGERRLEHFAPGW